MLLYAALATIVFAGIEVWAGYASASLALISDAGHMGSDALALGLAGLSAYLAKSGPDYRRTFGWAKAESVAGLLNAASMFALIAWIIWKAIGRISEPAADLNGAMVFGVGGLGLVMNLGIAWMLWRSEKTLGVKAALLHTASDALGSIGAMIAGVSQWMWGWAWVDPALSIGIALLVGKAAWSLLKETFDTLIDAAPIDLNVEAVQKMIEEIDGVQEVLDFHIWPLKAGEASLSAHLQIAPGYSCQVVIADVERRVQEKFGIRHTTIQPHEL
jgi:cobalt-zinc-cadmium efflux system protein